jgi:hypothetical protein
MHLDVEIENTKCKKPCESYTVSLVRRIEINDKKNKLYLGHDQVVFAKDYESECAAGADIS